jgi:predicted TIM-barrel fold metal-dependent hydrolase
MDMAGIYAAVFYGGTRKWQVDDPGLLIETYRTYNDFCLELSACEAGRLIYLPDLPTAYPDACLAEFHRLAGPGVTAMEFSVFDAGIPLNSPGWVPLWEAAAADCIVICSHTGHGAGVSRPGNERGSALAGHATSVRSMPAQTSAAAAPWNSWSTGTSPCCGQA